MWDLQETHARIPAFSCSSSSYVALPRARHDQRRRIYCIIYVRKPICIPYIGTYTYIYILTEICVKGGENRRRRRVLRDLVGWRAGHEEVKMEIRSRPRGLSFCRTTRMRNGGGTDIYILIVTAAVRSLLYNILYIYERIVHALYLHVNRIQFPSL